MTSNRVLQPRNRRKQENSPRVRLKPENPGEHFFSDGQWKRIGDALDLSQRELLVATLLLEGHSREAIAYRLHKADGKCLSPETVRVYIDRLYEKALVTDRAGLVLRLVRVFRDICQ